MWNSSITLEDYPLEEAMRITRELGFTRVEMWKHHLKRCRTEKLRRGFAEWSRAMGLEMGGLNAVGEPYFKPFGTDAELQATLDGLRADLEFAHHLGVRDLLIWEGVRPKMMGDLDCFERLLPRLIELFRQAIPMAEALGVRFLAEPHPFTVGMNDQFMIRLCDALDPARFGVLYDCCHFGVGQPQDYLGAIQRLGPRIRHIHFSDSDQKTSELHYTLGRGELDLEGILSAFKEIHYDGTLTLDLYGNPTPVESTKASIPMLQRAHQALGIPH